MDMKTKLIKWIRSMGYEPQEAIGIADNIIKKLKPYCKAMNTTTDKFITQVMNDTTCTSLGKFKDIANYRIKRKLKSNK